MDLETLSPRVRASLKKLQAHGKCRTWEELSELGPRLFRSYKGVGYQTMKEVGELLRERNLPWNVPKHPSLGFGEISIRARRFLRRAHCEDILDLAVMSRPEVASFTKIGDVTIQELERLLEARGLAWEMPRDLPGLKARLRARKIELEEDQRRLSKFSEILHYAKERVL